MTFNPLLSEIAFEPVPKALDEHYILRRDGVELELQHKEGYISATGNVYLTSLRLLFIPDNLDLIYGGIEMFLAVTALQFNQPIFGTNYLSGRLEPMPGGVSVASDFKIYFRNGSSTTFASIFTPLLEISKQHHYELNLNRARHSRSKSEAEVDGIASAPPIHLVRPLLNEGLMDPNDPTILYVLQPTFNEDAFRHIGGI